MTPLSSLAVSQPTHQHQDTLHRPNRGPNHHLRDDFESKDGEPEEADEEREAEAVAKDDASNCEDVANERDQIVLRSLSRKVAAITGRTEDAAIELIAAAEGKHATTIAFHVELVVGHASQRYVRTQGIIGGVDLVHRIQAEVVSAVGGGEESIS